MDEIRQEQIKQEITKEVAIKPNQEEQINALLDTVNTLVTKSNQSGKLTSSTKRIITIGIFTVAIIVSVGWASSTIGAKDALIVISSCITGGFALLRI